MHIPGFASFHSNTNEKLIFSYMTYVRPKIQNQCKVRKCVMVSLSELLEQVEV